ncbi:anther-specific proline-rich protein APG-like [Miscanthus floridulus]|uniref:anther-specific proline-rich protein APG-like n=1 Tax=Miscanthus floridulus TaxID=154761 RepID=UPI003458F14D
MPPRAAAPGRPHAATCQRLPAPAPRATLPSPCAAPAAAPMPASHRAAADSTHRRPSPCRAPPARAACRRLPPPPPAPTPVPIEEPVGAELEFPLPVPVYLHHVASSLHRPTTAPLA